MALNRWVLLDTMGPQQFCAVGSLCLKALLTVVKLSAKHTLTLIFFSQVDLILALHKNVCSH